MLGTPPAFVLSQDQTLDKWLYQSRSFYILDCLLAHFTNSDILFRYYPNLCHKKLNFYSTSFALFIFQCTTAVLRQLIYITTNFCVCQVLFEKKLIFLNTRLLKAVRRQSLTTILVYHSFGIKSTLFLFFYVI